MLKIGDFSRLSQVPATTLHHYADIGLFLPAHVDPSTNYRYYTLEQLSHIHRIIALKDLGLALNEIGQLLSQELSSAQIRMMLRLKKAEIQQQIGEDQRRLEMIEFRLRMLEAEENPPVLDVVLKHLPPLRVLVVPTVKEPVDLVTSERRMEQMTNAVHRAIAAGEIKFAGQSLSIYKGEDVPIFPAPPDEGWLMVEDDQPGDVQIDGGTTLALREIPAVEAAATLILVGHSPIIEWHTQTALILRWTVAHGYIPYNPFRMFHYRGPMQTQVATEWVTEIQIPIEIAQKSSSSQAKGES